MDETGLQKNLSDPVEDPASSGTGEQAHAGGGEGEEVEERAHADHGEEIREHGEQDGEDEHGEQDGEDEQSAAYALRSQHAERSEEDADAETVADDAPTPAGDPGNSQSAGDDQEAPVSDPEDATVLEADAPGQSPTPLEAAREMEEPGDAEGAHSPIDRPVTRTPQTPAGEEDVDTPREREDPATPADREDLETPPGRGDGLETPVERGAGEPADAREEVATPGGGRDDAATPAGGEDAASTAGDGQRGDVDSPDDGEGLYGPAASRMTERGRTPDDLVSDDERQLDNGDHGDGDDDDGGPAASGDGYEDDETVRPLDERWVFGMNTSMALQCLPTPGGPLELVYAAGHMVVIQDFAARTQRLLSVHSNNITCLSVSPCKRWIASADRGMREPSVQVWDANCGQPIQSIFFEPGTGARAIAWSYNSAYLGVLRGLGDNAVIQLYDWSDPEKTVPEAHLPLSDLIDDPQGIVFSPTEATQFIVWSSECVVMYCLDDGVVESRRPLIDAKQFSRVLGEITSCVFTTDGLQLMCSTSAGNLMEWGPQEVHVKEEGLDDRFIDPSDPTNPDAAPIMRMEVTRIVHVCDVPINFVTYVNDEYFVVGDEEGAIRFYGQDMKLRYWYDQLKEGPITAIVFSPDLASSAGGHHQHYPADASKMARRFAVPEFYVATRNTVLAKCTPLGRGKFEVLLREHSDEVHCTVAHPFLHRVITGGHEGYLRMWDYRKRFMLRDKRFGPGFRIQSLAMDPTAEYLAVGCKDGQLQILEALDLSEQSPVFTMSKGAAVKQLVFSHDGQYLACSDTSHCVTVYHRPLDMNVPGHSTASLGDAEEQFETPAGAGRPTPVRSRRQPGRAVPDQRPSWNYLGKYRSHYKPIQEIMFGINEDDGQPRLLSIGSDKMLVEYDLANSVEDDLRILTSDRVEQAAQPHCMAWYPRFTKELFLMTANSEYKIKLYNPATKMTRYTFQAECGQNKIDRMLFLPLTDREEYSDEGLQLQGYMAYTANDEIGLMQCPLDGNPYKNIGTISHPDGVRCLVSSYDGEYVFTAGGSDRSVVMYNVSRDAMDSVARAGGEGIVPFYTCLPGSSRDTPWFDRLTDYFYLTQLKMQGMDTQNPLEIGMTIPLSELPTLMRAIGFFPTEYEVVNLVNEVKFSTYSQTNEYKDSVDLEEAIRLYVNHLPRQRTPPLCKLEKAFERIGRVVGTNDKGEVKMAGLMKMLQDRGEHTTEAELTELMCYMMYSPEEYLDLPDDYQPGDALHTSSKPLAQNLNSSELLGNIREYSSAKKFGQKCLGMPESALYSA